MSILDEILQTREAYIRIGFNEKDPSKGGPFEAWLHDGPDPDDWDSFGVGESAQEALEQLASMVGRNRPTF